NSSVDNISSAILSAFSTTARVCSVCSSVFALGKHTSFSSRTGTTNNHSSIVSGHSGNNGATSLSFHTTAARAICVSSSPAAAASTTHSRNQERRHSHLQRQLQRATWLSRIRVRFRNNNTRNQC